LYSFWTYFHKIGSLKLVIREYFTDLYCDMPIHRNHYAVFYNHVNCKMAIIKMIKAGVRPYIFIMTPHIMDE